MPPESLYKKANELLNLASQEVDPEIRKLRIETARRYFEADTNKHKPNFIPILIPIVYFIIIVAAICLVISQFGFLICIAIFIIAMAIMPFLAGIYLRMTGKITEGGLISLYKEGVKTLLSLNKKSSSRSERES